MLSAGSSLLDELEVVEPDLERFMLTVASMDSKDRAVFSEVNWSSWSELSDANKQARD